jgi:peptidoglycan/LPS O-acetylase OafA/YrhL
MLLLLRTGISTDVIWFAGIGTALLTAWLVHVWIEKPTHRLASDVARRVSALTVADLLGAVRRRAARRQVGSTEPLPQRRSA